MVSRSRAPTHTMRPAAATRGDRGDRGSATLQAVVALAIAAIATGGLVGLLLTASTRLATYLSTGRERETLRAAVEDRLQALREDPTPSANWGGDPLWTQAAAASDGVSVTIRDASSALNPNYLRKALIERSWLASVFGPSETPASLQQDREDNGLSTSIDQRYAEFFRPEGFELLTGYGYANVNTSDEFVLRWIVRSRTGDTVAAEQFWLAVQRALQQRRTIAASELETMLGRHSETVAPLITTEPQINVHFADPRLLRLLAGYPAHAVVNPDAKVDTLLSRRDARELGPTDLITLFGVPANHPLLQYLGVRTWFWEIAASSGPHTLTVVVARLPDKDADATPAYRIVEERYR